MERTSIPLKPPKRCLEGICDWSLLLIGPQIEWQLAAPPEIGLNVGVAEVVPAELASEPVTGEPIRIGRDEVVRLVATVKVDASLVSGQDFVVMGPVVAVEFRLDRDTTDAHLMFARDTGFATTSEDSTTVAINQVGLECDNLTCSAVVELPLSFSEQAEGTVTWEAQAYIPYMPGGQLPAGAVVDLEVER